MERCGWCGGEGYIWDDWDCGERVCSECGGSGYVDVDPYQEDEWYEEGGNDE